jgi:S-adenosylmethionine decarboxylase
MDNATEHFGVHFMLDGYGADPDVLSNKEILTDMLTSIPAKLGMHTISSPLVVEVGPLNKKDPGGISGFVLIAESHLSFHTFPKRGFVTIDVYTCQNELDTNALTALFQEMFKFNDVETFLQLRGTKYPSENIF